MRYRDSEAKRLIHFGKQKSLDDCAKFGTGLALLLATRRIAHDAQTLPARVYFQVFPP